MQNPMTSAQSEMGMNPAVPQGNVMQGGMAPVQTSMQNMMITSPQNPMGTFQMGQPMNGNGALSMEDENKPRTVYVGNLDHQVTEHLMLSLFGVIGPCMKCNMIKDPTGMTDPYCFIEFYNHKHACTAIQQMNGRKIMGKEVKVDWATKPSNKKDMSNPRGFAGRGDMQGRVSDCVHIFVGDLSPEITDDQLLQFFQPYFAVHAKVVRDAHTNASKGYGFVAFTKRTDAEQAINQMRGQTLGCRQIRTNWATRKPGVPDQKLDYNTVLAQSSQTNCTVYVGGLQSGASEMLLRNAFQNYGAIQEVRVFPDKGYAFVRLSSHNDAARAIVDNHGTSIGDNVVKCSWGKEGAGTSSAGSYANRSNQAGANQWNSTEVWNPQQPQQQQAFGQWNGSQWSGYNAGQGQNTWGTWDNSQTQQVANMGQWAAWSNMQQQTPQQAGDGWGSNMQQANSAWGSWNPQQQQQMMSSGWGAGDNQQQQTPQQDVGSFAPQQ